MLSYISPLQRWHSLAPEDSCHHDTKDSQSTSSSNPTPLVPSGILTRLFNQIDRIQNSQNYNKTIGKDLGIIYFYDMVERLAPEYWLTTESGLDARLAQIDFTKYGINGIWT